MAIRAECQSCFSVYNVSNELAGKSVRCKSCGTAVKIPRPNQDDELDLFSTDAPSASSPMPLPKRRPASTQKKKSKTSSDPSSTLMKRIGIGIAMFLLLVGFKIAGRLAGKVVAVGTDAVANQVSGTNSLSSPSAISTPALSGPASFSESALFDLSQVQMDLPELNSDRFQLTKHPQAWIYRLVASSERPKSRPASRMELRVSLPPGEHPAGSLPCVLVPPAGTALFTGTPIDRELDNPEHIPYVQAGYAVVTFSLDGWSLSESPSDAELKMAYNDFVGASAGLANAQVAFKFAQTRLPMVNPNQILIAGHSSAGTLALLYAAHQPKLAGCLAYAPQTNVEEHLRPMISNAQVNAVLPHLKEFAHRSSPITHVKQIQCPTFVFHAVGDPVVSIESTRAFCRQLPQVNFVEGSGSDHYKTMVSHGVPAGIKWIETLIPSRTDTQIASSPPPTTTPPPSSPAQTMSSTSSPAVKPATSPAFAMPPGAVPETASRTSLPPGTRALDGISDLSPGQYVLALFANDWKGAEIVEVDSPRQATVHYLGMSEGFDQSLTAEKICIPLAADGLDPTLVKTLEFAILRNPGKEKIDLEPIETCLRENAGYVPDTLRLTSSKREFTVKVIKGSNAEQRAWTAFTRAHIPTRQTTPR